jgi:hypothetical protein
MRVTSHPTWIAGHEDPGEDPDRWIHAALWLDVELSDWSVRRREHLHLVAPERDLDRWSRVDIAALPMRPADLRDAAAAPPSAEAVDALRRWLDDWELAIHRHPGLGMVSALGEAVEVFHRRVLGVVRPEVQRRVRPQTEERDPPRWPWPVRSEDPSRQEMVRGIAEIGGEIESRTVYPVSEFLRRVEVGVVLAPAGDDLSRTGTVSRARSE